MIILGLVFVVLGLTLGFVVSWTRGLTESLTTEQTGIQEMFEKIDGYLDRDERRELDQ